MICRLDVLEQLTDSIQDVVGSVEGGELCSHDYCPVLWCIGDGRPVYFEVIWVQLRVLEDGVGHLAARKVFWED